MTHHSEAEMSAGQAGRSLLAWAQMVHETVGASVQGMSQQDSLNSLSGGGNSANWVLGHLIVTYDFLLPRLGQEPVAPGALSRYRRGSAPLTDPDEASQLTELISIWAETARRVEEGIGRLGAEDLADTPGDLPKSAQRTNLGDFITALLFHQAYHAGQLGLLRRSAGLEPIPA